jgi:hypothetical protein
MRVSSQNLENISQRMAREISFGILLLMAKGQHPTLCSRLVEYVNRPLWLRTRKFGNFQVR